LYERGKTDSVAQGAPIINLSIENLECGKIVPPLHFVVAEDNVFKTLRQIYRTGWVQWKIPNPENVYEHIVATRELAYSFCEMCQLDERQFTRLIDMIEVHDWPEALEGDQVIMGDEPDVMIRRKVRHEREMAAMKKLTATIPGGA